MPDATGSNPADPAPGRKHRRGRTNSIRITYAGGYVLPGNTPDPGQTPLPADLEQAALEQVACRFQNRDKLGIRTSWPTNGTYQQFFFLDLLPSVTAVLHTHRRYSL